MDKSGWTLLIKFELLYRTRHNN